MSLFNGDDNGGAARKVLTTALGMLLAAGVTGSFSVYNKLGKMSSQMESMNQRMTRLEEKVQRLDNRLYRERLNDRNNTQNSDRSDSRSSRILAGEESESEGS